MLNFNTSSSEKPIFVLTNFKVLLSNLKNDLNNYIRCYFEKHISNENYLFDQNRISTKKTIELSKYNNFLNQTFTKHGLSIHSPKSKLQRISFFQKVFKVEKSFNFEDI
jgi:hypothetical protein